MDDVDEVMRMRMTTMMIRRTTIRVQMLLHGDDTDGDDVNENVDGEE